MKDIKLGVPFTIERGGRKATYKITRHPEVKDIFALIADHPHLKYNTPSRDERYLINSGLTIEDTYEKAVWHT